MANFELIEGQQSFDATGRQATIVSFLKQKAFEAFGSFSGPDGYSGAVPSDCYLSAMLIKAIEVAESDANQHTSCLPIDILSIDDSYKVSSFFQSLELIELISQ